MPQNDPSAKKGNFSIGLIAGVAALAGLLFGYDTGVISGAILFIKDQFHLTSGLQEMVVSAVLLGAVIGALFSGPVADGIGRRRSVIITAVLFAVGSVGAALANHVIFLVLFRFVIGLAIGVASYTAPLYISEIAPPRFRGALVTLNQLMITVGIFLSYIVDFTFADKADWRMMFGIGVVPAIILAIGMILLPETPRWLISKNFVDKARSVLKLIRGNDGVEEEISEIQATLTQKVGSWRELFEPWVRPALIVGIALAFFQQVTGINTIIYYAPTIFGFAGFESAKASIFATAGVGLVNVGMTVVAIWLLDKLGRKPLLYIGLIGMTVSLGVIGLAFQFSASSAILKWMTVGSLILYIASFAISLGPIFWLMIAEIYPLRIRGRAMSLATVANWGFNMLVAASFLTLIEKLGKPGTFWFYGIVSIIGLWFCWRFVPETKGHSLEKIEAHLHSNKKFSELI